MAAFPTGDLWPGLHQRGGSASIPCWEGRLIYLLPLAAALGALGRRVAGGAFQQWTGLDIGDLPVRIFFGLTIAVAAYLGGAILWQSALLIPAIWAGTTAPNFEGIAQGRSGHPFWKDFFALMLHGVLGVALPALWAWWFGFYWPLVLLSGVLISPLYDLGWALTGIQGLHWLPNGFRGGSELGETFWGAAVATAMFVAVSLG